MTARNTAPLAQPTSGPDATAGGSARRALMLCGGGAKAVWQVGACDHLIGERRYWFDIIAGVSAGAVNGATLAQAHDPQELDAELEHLRSVWLGIRGDRDVYRRRWLGALGVVLGRQAGLYDVGPLRGILQHHIDPERVATSPVQLRVGYVDLLSGEYRTAGNDHPALRDAVLASCALPVVFPPVPLGNGQELGVDGGVRHVTALSDALETVARLPQSGAEPDEVWVLSPRPLSDMRALRLSDWLRPALRSLSTLTGEMLPPDVEGLQDAARNINVRLRVLHPAKDLGGASLDFDPARLRAWYEDGLRVARQLEAPDLAA